jgi:O-antigen/teichoic acid export membrane protein
MATNISLRDYPFWTDRIRPRFRGLRDYANNVWIEIILTGLGFVSGILVARWLGPSGRGQLAAAMLWPGVIGILISLGLQHAFAYAVGVGWAKPDRLQRLGAKFTLLVALPAMAIYWWICPWILGSQFPQQTWIPGIFALYIPLAVYAGFLLPIYQGSGDFKRWNIARVFRSGSWTLAVLLAVVLGWLTVLNLLVVQLATLLLLCIYLYSRLGRLQDSGKGEGTAPTSVIFRYGLAIYLSGLAYTVNQQLDQLLLSVWVTPSDLGQYAAAVTLAGAILVIPTAMGPIGFSKVTRATHDPSEQRRHVKVAFAWSAVLLVPAGLAVAFLAPWITKILYGEAYGHSAALLRILAPAAISLGMGMILADVLRGMGKPMYATYGAVGGAAITIVGLLLTLRRFGTLGAAWVSFTAYTAMMLIQCYFLWRLLGDTPKDSASQETSYRLRMN